MAVGVVTYKPTEFTLLPASQWKAYTGSSTITAVSGSYTYLADNSTSTYVYNGSASSQNLEVGFASITLGSGEYVRRVRYAVRMYRRTTAAKIAFSMGYKNAPTAIVGTKPVTANGAGVVTLSGLQSGIGWYYGAWVDSIGGVPVHAVRDYLNLCLTEYKAGSNSTNLYELWIEVEIAKKPTTSVTTPATGGTVTNTTKPSIGWTFSSLADYQYYATSKSSSGTTRTLTFSSHAFYVGQTITVEHQTPDTNFDGTWVVTSITATTITYTGSASYTLTTTALTTYQCMISASQNDPQVRYETKVYSAAQYGAGGFDPSTSSATFSASANTSDVTVLSGSLSNSTTYRAYARTAKSWSGETVGGDPYAWSSWDYSQFTISLSPPSAPAISSIAWDSTNQRVTFTATSAATNSGGYTDPYVTIERSENGGTTWTSVYGFRATSLAFGSVALSVVDPLCDRTVGSLSYRTKLTATFPSDTQTVDVYSSTSTVSPTTDSKWWLKSVANSTLNIGNLAVLVGVGADKEETLGVFKPIGRSTSVVVAGDLYGWDGSFKVFTKTSAERAAFKSLLDHQGALLVQDPFGEQRYIRVTSRKQTLPAGSTPSNPITEWEFDFVQVSAP